MLPIQLEILLMDVALWLVATCITLIPPLVIFRILRGDTIYEEYPDLHN